MKYKAIITRVIDGARCVLELEYPNDSPDEYEASYYLEFLWEEGNYSCDCNRALMFIRGREGREPDESELPCTEGKYTVELEYEHIQ